MGDLTRAQLRVEVANNLGERSDLGSGEAGETTLNRALDRVQTRIARANINGWSELKDFDAKVITITDVPEADVYYSDLPSNLNKIVSLLHYKEGNSHTTRITGIPRPQWDHLMGAPPKAATSSVIYHYTEERTSPTNRQLRWWPVPNVNFTLYRLLLLKPTPFADDDAVSDFEDKDDLLIAGTTHYMLNRYQAFEEAEQWRKGYNDQLQTAIKDDKNQPDIAWIPRGISIADHHAPNDPWTDPFVKCT